MLNTAVKAARSASKVLFSYLENLAKLQVDVKGHNDFVTAADKSAEKEIIAVIQETYPDHAFLGEESGMIGESEYVWVIDPLDGTTNFIHGFPSFGISIALMHKGKALHGVIYDPLTNELFTASKGAGAYCNNRRLRVSNAAGLKGSLVGIGFPYREPDKIVLCNDIVANIFPHIAGFRVTGSAVLTLAYVAAGYLDAAFWLASLSPWDIAAGVLIVQEAGGLVSNFAGSEEFTSGEIVVGSPKPFKGLLQVINKLS